MHPDLREEIKKADVDLRKMFGKDSELESLDINTIHLDKTDSTNSFLRRQTELGLLTEGITMVWTEEQYGGRGQRGNTWESEPGKNLTFSLLIHPTFLAPSRQFLLSQAMALAVVNTLCKIDEAEKDAFSVKWPNDIYWNDYKIGGTLIECDLQGRSIKNCIIGTGLNLNQTEFRGDAPNPVSLIQIFNREFQPAAVLDDICSEFLRLYGTIQKGGASRVASAYKRRLYRRKGTYPYEDSDGEFYASIQDIKPAGHLILRDTDGNIRRYAFKEVRFL